MKKIIVDSGVFICYENPCKSWSYARQDGPCFCSPLGDENYVWPQSETHEMCFFISPKGRIEQSIYNSTRGLLIRRRFYLKTKDCWGKWQNGGSNNSSEIAG